MKATFLGHGIDSGNKPSVGGQISLSLKSYDYHIFNGFVAFATLAGIEALKPCLEIAKSKHKHFRFYIGVDNRVTSEDALEFLLNENIETYIYFDEKNNFSIYHPKLYLFEGIDYSRLIIGSSNLTYQALKTNVEASIQLDFNKKDKLEDLGLLNEIKEYYSSLLDLSSPYVKLLTRDYLDYLIKKGLLSNYNDKPDDNVATDSDSNDEYRKDYEKSFTDKDKEQFELFLNRYMQYKQTERPDGIVSKHTQDKELLNWYQKMHALYGQGTNSFPFEIFEKLLDVDFPFDGIGVRRKQLIKWNQDFQKLLDYKNKVDPNNDYTYVPQYGKSNRYYKIGQWCAYQKQRRKGNKNYGMEWTPYEEEKMKSIKFVWDVSTIENRLEDDKWTDNLVEIEKYYSKKKNYKTVPSQKTYIGHWLSDQMSFKTKQDREGRSDLISLERENMLGELLSKNSVEWEFNKQKHRESIEEGLKKWRELRDWENKLGNRKPTKEENAYYKPIRGWIASTRNRSKTWTEKDLWKKEMLIKAGFPLPENE